MSGKYLNQLAYEFANRPLWLVVIETGLFVVLCLITLIGNSCVLFVFYKTASLRSRGTTFYLIALAISDILMASIVIPANTICCAYGRDVTGFKGGQVIGFIGFALLYGSLQTTTLVAINRFFCVVKPQIYRKYFTKKLIIISIAVVWVISIVFLSVYIIGVRVSFRFHPGNILYFPTSESQTVNRVFAALSQLSFGVVPLVITCICYWKVHHAVKQHRNAVSHNFLSKEEVHVTKSVLALVFGFALCWIPCSMVHHVSVYIEIPRHVHLIMPYTAYLSSAINPIVYNIFNKPFRRRFFQVFRLSTKVGSSSTDIRHVTKTVGRGESTPSYLTGRLEIS